MGIMSQGGRAKCPSWVKGTRQRSGVPPLQHTLPWRDQVHQKSWPPLSEDGVIPRAAYRHPKSLLSAQVSCGPWPRDMWMCGYPPLTSSCAIQQGTHAVEGIPVPCPLQPLWKANSREAGNGGWLLGSAERFWEVSQHPPNVPLNLTHFPCDSEKPLQMPMPTVGGHPRHRIGG